MELGNGNTENTNVAEMRKLFQKEKQNREQKNLIVPPIDEEFLEALEKMQDTTFAGIGLGVERLVMLFMDTKDIEDVRLL
jgi:elongation factor P--beta-lysine ligase